MDIKNDRKYRLTGKDAYGTAISCTSQYLTKIRALSFHLRKQGFSGDVLEVVEDDMSTRPLFRFFAE